MSKPDSKMPHAMAPRLAVNRPVLLAAACAALLQAPLVASAGLAAIEEPAPTLERSAPAKSPAGSGYRLRCWQHGRLLFEEDDIALPPDGSRYTLKLAGRDRDGRPLYVTETLNATCLVRHAPAASVNPALPR